MTFARTACFRMFLDPANSRFDRANAWGVLNIRGLVAVYLCIRHSGRKASHRPPTLMEDRRLAPRFFPETRGPPSDLFAVKGRQGSTPAQASLREDPLTARSLPPGLCCRIRQRPSVKSGDRKDIPIEGNEKWKRNSFDHRPGQQVAHGPLSPRSLPGGSCAREPGSVGPPTSSCCTGEPLCRSAGY